MKNNSELTYIDKLASQKLSDMAIQPATKFENLNFSNLKTIESAALKTAFKLKISHLIFSAITAIVTLTAIIVINTDKKKTVSPKTAHNKINYASAKKSTPPVQNTIKFEQNKTTKNTPVIIKKRIIVKDTIYIDKNK